MGPVIDDVKTIRPLRLAFMAGKQALTVRKVPLRYSLSAPTNALRSRTLPSTSTHRCRIISSRNSSAVASSQRYSRASPKTPSYLFHLFERHERFRQHLAAVNDERLARYVRGFVGGKE